MEKLLIRLSVPAAQKCFDLFLPQDVPIRQVVRSAADGVRDMTNGRYAPSGREMLIPEGAEAPLAPEKHLEQYGIRDGDRLIMI